MSARKTLQEVLEFSLENCHKSNKYKFWFKRFSVGNTIKYTSRTKINDAWSNELYNYPINIENELCGLIIEQLCMEAVNTMLRNPSKEKKYINNLDWFRNLPHSILVVSPEIFAVGLSSHKELVYEKPTDMFMWMPHEGNIFGKKVYINPYLPNDQCCLLMNNDCSFTTELEDKLNDEGLYVINTYLTVGTEILHYNVDIPSCQCGNENYFANAAKKAQ